MRNFLFFLYIENTTSIKWDYRKFLLLFSIFRSIGNVPIKMLPSDLVLVWYPQDIIAQRPFPRFGTFSSAKVPIHAFLPFLPVRGFYGNFWVGRQIWQSSPTLWVLSGVSWVVAYRGQTHRTDDVRNQSPHFFALIINNKLIGRILYCC